jgi:hypothetical protein
MVTERPSMRLVVHGPQQAIYIYMEIAGDYIYLTHEHSF